MTTDKLEFSDNWFPGSLWNQNMDKIKPPKRCLEIGTYEGMSSCYLIEKWGNKHDIELHCVDTWEGGKEHKEDKERSYNWSEVKERCLRNLEISKKKVKQQIDIHIHHGNSREVLPKLLAEGKREYFDFIYIDGSHEAPDVLFDAVLSYELLAPYGTLVFDDYIWGFGSDDSAFVPKTAIDSFVNVNCHNLLVMPTDNRQFWVQKFSIDNYLELKQ